MEELKTLEAEFFLALCEPVRLQLIKLLATKGRTDIKSLATGFSQDRSVIARHLQVLARSGIVKSAKVGRHQFFELDGPAILSRLEQITDAIRKIVPTCCP
jgi:DNA-binding transcriptional ArsR family regulator